MAQKYVWRAFSYYLGRIRRRSNPNEYSRHNVGLWRWSIRTRVPITHIAYSIARSDNLSMYCTTFRALVQSSKSPLSSKHRDRNVITMLLMCRKTRRRSVLLRLKNSIVCARFRPENNYRGKKKLKSRGPKTQNSSCCYYFYSYYRRDVNRILARPGARGDH